MSRKVPVTSLRREDAMTFPTITAANDHRRMRERESGHGMRVAWFAREEWAIVVGIDSWLSVDDRSCQFCGGTVLAPTMGGVPRGTCHCAY